MNYLKRKLSKSLTAIVLSIIILFNSNIYTYGDERGRNNSDEKEEDIYSMTLLAKRQSQLSLLKFCQYGPVYRDDGLSLMDFIIENEEKEEEVSDTTEVVPKPAKELTTLMMEDKVEIKKMSREPYIGISQLQISYDMDLSQRTGLMKKDFVYLMESLQYDYSGFFKENAELIYDLCEEYQINEIFFVGLIAAESGWEIHPAHKATHNYISMMSGAGMIGYSDLEAGLRESARLLHENYLTEGGCYYHGTTIPGVKVNFCPASPSWGGLVFGCMQLVIS